MPSPVLNIDQFSTQGDTPSFYVNTFSTHLACNHKDITVPHKHDFYLSVLFTHGKGTHEIDFNAYPIHPGALFFLHPGQTHNWQFSDDIEGIIFFHNRAFYDGIYAHKSMLNFPFFRSLQNRPYLSLKKNSYTETHRTFQAILLEYRQELPFKTSRITSLIDLLYIDFTRLLGLVKVPSPQANSSYLQKTHDLEHLINWNFRVEKSVSEYAQRMHMTAKHLNRIVHTTLGKTTSQLIMERVILEAKRMLVNPKNSLLTISNELGFNDYAYFSRAFKKHTQESPSQFQKRYRD